MIDRADTGHAAEGTQRRIHLLRRREPRQMVAQILQALLHLCLGAADGDVVVGGAGDGLEIGPGLGAVLAQDLGLVREAGGRAVKVGVVGVLRRDGEGDLLAAAIQSAPVTIGNSSRRAEREMPGTCAAVE